MMVAVHRQDQVVGPSLPGEIGLPVVYRPARAEGEDRLQVPLAAGRGDLASQGFRDLHREASHPARGSLDQDLLPRPKLPLVPQGLESGERREGDGRSLLERELRGLEDDLFLAREGVLGEASALMPLQEAEDLVADFEAFHTRADRLDGPGSIRPEYPRPGPEEPACLEADEEGIRPHPAIVPRVDRGSADPDQDLILRRGGFLDVPQHED